MTARIVTIHLLVDENISNEELFDGMNDEFRERYVGGTYGDGKWLGYIHDWAYDAQFASYPCNSQDEEIEGRFTSRILGYKPFP